MRILFTFIGGSGHFIPLVSIARAAHALGHTVAFGCSPSMREVVAAEGFNVLPLGNSQSAPPERAPLRPLDVAREEQEFRDRFARDGAQRRAPLTYQLCAESQPDVLVCDETDFGSMVAAERFGIPYATVIVIATGSLTRKEIVGDALQELRAQNNLPSDPRLEMLHRYLVLNPAPPSFRDPAFPLPKTAHSFRPFANPRAVSPLSHKFPSDAPLIYFTLGTVFNLESGDLFTRVFDGLRALDVNIVVTVGAQIDPAEFGALPENIFIANYIPQETILPHCALVVSHGGSGSVLGALAHGLPMVLIPMGADQPANTTRCTRLRVAEMLDPITATAESVRVAVRNVLSNATYRANAERLREEFAALPDVTSAVRWLEGIAEKQSARRI